MSSTARPRTRAPTTPSDLDAGTLVGIHGLRGDLKFAPTRSGADALAAGLELDATLKDGATRRLVVASVRMHQNRPLVRFAGVDDATAAAPLVGARLRVARDDVPVGEGEYFDHDLVGCRLEAPDGTPLGEVVDVAHYPASDMLVVGPRRALVPLVAAFIREVDIVAKRIVAELPDGLLDDERAERAP